MATTALVMKDKQANQTLKGQEINLVRAGLFRIYLIWHGALDSRFGDERA